MVSGIRGRRSWWQRFGSWLRGHPTAIVVVTVVVLVFGVTVVFMDRRSSERSANSPNEKVVDQSGGAGAVDSSATPSRTASVSAAPGISPNSSPNATPAASPEKSGYPSALNTGVPTGARLTDYAGPCTISADNTVIDSSTVNCDLVIQAENVVIKRSKVNGNVETSERTSYSFALQDSEVDAGLGQFAAVASTNMTIERSNIHGGVTSVYCYANCTIRDSWLHGQRLAANAPWHLGAFLANDDGGDPGGRTNATLVHNTIECDATPNTVDGGCSGDINLYGDFGPITYVTLSNNLLGANVGLSYCVYGGESSSKPYPHADHVVVTGNTFQRGSNGKCGGYGPVTAFDTSQPGNLWENNVWDDGSPVAPSN